MTPRSEAAALSGVAALLSLAFACSPGDAEPACRAGEVQDSASGACVPEVCGPGPWGAGNDPLVHVAPAGSDDGDGSADRPLRSIQLAADRAGEAGGGVVALSAGTWTGGLQFDQAHDGVELVGRCAALTILEGTDPESPVIALLRGRLEVRHLSLTGAGPGIRARRESTMGLAPEVVATDLVIDRATRYGVLSDGSGSRVELVDTVIRDIQLYADGTRGRGVNVQSGGELIGRRLRIEGVHEFGIFAHGDQTEVTLQETRVEGTQAADWGGGWGIDVLSGAHLVATDLLLDDNEGLGLALRDVGTSAELSNSVVRATRSDGDGTIGRGVSVQTGASLVASGLAVEDNRHVGLFASGQGTTVQLDDVRVSGTRPAADGTLGRGVGIESGASMQATGLEVEGSEEVGINFAGATASLVDCAVRSTGVAYEGGLATAMWVGEGSDVSAARLVVEDNHGAGVTVHGEGSRLELGQSAIRDTSARWDGAFGVGLLAWDQVTLIATDVVLERNSGTAMLFEGPETAVELTDVSVSDGQPLGSTSGGTSLAVQTGAAVLAERLVVEGGHYIGVFVTGEQASLTLLDSEISNVLPRPDGKWGWGGSIQLGATLHGDGLLVRGNHGIGLAVLGSGTSADLQDVVIEDTSRDAGRYAGLGLTSEWGAAVHAQGLVVTGGDGPGLVTSEGEMVVEDVLLQGNGFAGAVLTSGRLELDGGRVEASVPSARSGGGTGVFVADTGHDRELAVRDVTFSGHRYPGVYLRGPGRYEVTDCTFEDSGATAPPTPGGVLAVDVPLWSELGPDQFEGLALRDNVFADLASDAVLLHGSSALIEGSVFDQVGGLAVRWQECDQVDAPQVDAGGPAAIECQQWSQSVDPMLSFEFDPSESDVVE